MIPIAIWIGGLWDGGREDRDDATLYSAGHAMIKKKRWRPGPCDGRRSGVDETMRRDGGGVDFDGLGIV